MLLCFVSIRRGNHFMTELLSMLSAAVATAGHDVDFAFDEFPPLADDAGYVVIPHEFHAQADTRSFPNADQCARTIALCTENPGTEWFEHACDLLPQFGAAMAINRASVTELRRRGIACEHLQLGYSPLWDSWQRDERAERPIDVLYLGATDLRRDALLAGYGRHLWARDCQFLVPPLESRAAPRPDYLTGMDKYQRLRAAQVLLNLHRAQSASMEWVRFLESASNGCVMVSEPCLDHQPLVPGEHFLAASAESLPLVAGRLLDDPDRLRSIRLAAYDYVREQLPMREGAELLAALAAETLEHAASAPPAPTRAAGAPHSPLPLRAPAPAPPPENGMQTLGKVVRALSVETRELHRAVQDVAHRVSTGEPPSVEILAATPAYGEAAPRVTVMVTVCDYAREVLEALGSVAASRYGDLEVLVLDDASSDGSDEAVAGFLQAHPWLPGMLLRQPVNRGLARSRNTLLERGRGEYVFILDADNGIYPSALSRLVAALDADAQATFAYPMIAVFREGRADALLSALPWEPERLRSGNYIDAMALIRREHLVELGGYTTEPRLTGWEDFDLWCRCAEAGRYGILVPQVLAWYRRTAHSMLSDVETSTTVAWSLMRTRFPDLLGAPTTAAASAPT